MDIDEQGLRAFLEKVPFSQAGASRQKAADKVPLPAAFAIRTDKKMSTQEAFGRVLNDLGRGDSELARHIVTTSPDVTVSTNLGGWVNQRGIFNRADREDVFHSEKVVSMQKWAMSRNGQHIELGIAENNMFLLLASLGLSEPLFGARLLPVGTVYDPFIARGLDALNYACYQDARFMLVGTPSGVSLAPEGGAHQSISTPLIGMGQPGLTMFEPAFADELAEIMLWGFGHMQAADGGSLYMRLSTRAIEQARREMSETLRGDILNGAYWRVAPAPDAPLALAYSGALAAETEEAYQALLEDIPGAGLLAVTSPDRLHCDWLAARQARSTGKAGAQSHIETLLGQLRPGAALISVLDGHPATLSWLGSVAGHRPYPLGVSTFGESGDVNALYRKHAIDSDAILDMAALACLDAAR
jgi:pyruvate dehydrogenase E1 component